MSKRGQHMSRVQVQALQAPELESQVRARVQQAPQARPLRRQNRRRDTNLPQNNSTQIRNHGQSWKNLGFWQEHLVRVAWSCSEGVRPCAGQDMLTLLSQCLVHTLGCQDAAVCQGAGRQCRGQGAQTLELLLGAIECPSALFPSAVDPDIDTPA